MKFKKVKKIVSVIFIILGMIILLCENVKNKQVESKNKNYNFESNRMEDIKAFQEKADLTNAPKGVHSENSGGNQEIEIINREKFIDTGYTSLDGMLQITKLLDEGVNNLIHIKDRANMQINIDKDLTNFYNGNAEEFRKLYGIDNYKEFMKFKKILKAVNFEDKIINAEINVNTLKKERNIIAFDLVTKTDKNHIYTFQINEIEYSIGNKRGFSSKWINVVEK